MNISSPPGGAFATLALAPPVAQALARSGYAEPTPIQAAAIPPLLEGRDLIGIAQTGTGKTAAFLAPSLTRLLAQRPPRRRRQCRMLVLSPTRELASQIADKGRGYAAGAGLSVATVFGGTSLGRNRLDVQAGVDLLVATPGRLLDLVEQGHLLLDGVEILVLDEADQMLDLGFIHALRRIVKLVPARRQTLLFSATMPAAIRDLGQRFLSNPVEVAVTPAASTVERVDQEVIHVSQSEKQALLTLLVRSEEIDRALIFVRTKHGADKVVRLLAANGVPAGAIHGNKSQPQRTRAMEDFRERRLALLVATDIAARGIDIPGVSHVFNVDLPNVPEQYVHRIGRTARAGAAGRAIAFCSDEERPFLRDIERLIGQKLTVRALPAGFVAEAGRLAVERRRNAPAEAPPAERRAPRPPARGGGRPARAAPAGRQARGRRARRNP